jgi:hypothetical protein
MENDSGMILTGENQRTWRKICPSATLSTTNPIWIDTGMNLGLHGERPLTNHLNHGMAPEKPYINLFHAVTYLLMHDLLNSFVQILLFANILYSEKASSL